MKYVTLLCGLVVISSHVIFGGKEVNVSQGTHLTSLRESDEWKGSSSLQKSPEFSVPDALKIDDRPRYSSSVVYTELNRLHASEEYQVVAAWIQITWLQQDKSVVNKMKNSDRWKGRGERVKRLLSLLEQASLAEASVAAIYERCFQKTEVKDRCVPGCGNDRRVLIRPEFFSRKAGFYPLKV